MYRWSKGIKTNLEWAALICEFTATAYTQLFLTFESIVVPSMFRMSKNMVNRLIVPYPSIKL